MQIKFLTRFIFLLCFALGCQSLTAQTFVLRGVVLSGDTKEPLIGAVVTAEGTNAGAVTDIDGKFELSLAKGTYTIKTSYVGFEGTTREVILTNPETNIYIEMGANATQIKEVLVTADQAIDRKTPVAFSNISNVALKENLGTQDLPMVLNFTPGAYATARGGGDGDSRVNIRGFSQRNVAVMLDGIPVNDVENGQVFWSNWFGLSLVTKTMQVQRGLGSSKIAIPSVGGTINILTKGIDSKREFSIKQEIANNNYAQTTLGYNSGRLSNGWGLSLAGAYKTNSGWADGTFSKAWFYYFKVEKEIGKHLFTLSGFGGPQSHGQRASAKAIWNFDSQTASDVGVPADKLNVVKSDPSAYFTYNKGLRYNDTWGYTDSAKTNIYNTKVNYYHKPQFSLRHSYQISPSLFISSVAYLSIGNGGGTTGQRGFNQDSTDGSLKIYETIKNNTNPIFNGAAGNFVYSSNNNHFWYGLLSTARAKLAKNFNFTGGIDLRYYNGIHTNSVYDLLGADTTYVFGPSLAATDYRNARQPRSTAKLKKDDIYFRNYESHVQWYGTFGTFEYSNKKFSAFVNLAGAVNRYQYTDHLLAKTLNINGDTYYTSYWDSSRFYLGRTPVNRVAIVNGTMYTVDHSGAPTLRYAEKNGLKVDSTTAQDQQLGWVTIPSYTIKGGLSYNFNRNHGVFFNLGYLTRPMRFDNVFTVAYNSASVNILGQNGQPIQKLDDIGLVRQARNIQNEGITAFEAGYNYRDATLAFNVNAYFTNWENRPLESIVRVSDQNSPFYGEPYTLTGLNALHQGIEVEGTYKPHPKVEIGVIASLGDWIWNSKGTLISPDGSVTEFDPRGVHVGDAAQAQLGGSVRFAPVKGAYLSLRGVQFSKNYTSFNPENLKDANAQRESWKLPTYFMLDLSAGYNFRLEKTAFMSWRFGINNLLNTTYIADGNNNINETSFNPQSATVFFGQGIRWNTSLEFTF